MIVSVSSINGIENDRMRKAIEARPRVKLSEEFMGFQPGDVIAVRARRVVQLTSERFLTEQVGGALVQRKYPPIGVLAKAEK